MDRNDVAKSLLKLAKQLTARDADTEYQYKFRAVTKRLNDVEKLLKKHADQQAKNYTDWGYTGDIAHIDEQLVEIIRFLS